jgi:hypothetical protein
VHAWRHGLGQVARCCGANSEQRGAGLLLLLVLVLVLRLLLLMVMLSLLFPAQR